MVHIIPVHTTMTAMDLSSIYLREIVRLHGLPESIVSDRDTRFTSRWWRELHRLLGAKLLMSTSFHPQTDGVTERANRNIGQILRAMIRPDQSDWVEKLPMVEFAINSSVSSSTQYAPFELGNGYMPTMLKQLPEGVDVSPGVKAFSKQALFNLAQAHESIIASRVFQRHNANQRRQTEPVINIGDMVYLSTANLALPKGRAHKLMPKFIGPYPVTEAFPETSNYSLQLPDSLNLRRLHSKFHVNLLRPYEPNDDVLFPDRTQVDAYDFGAPDDSTWVVDDILSHRWRGKRLEFHVQWNLGDTTWEPQAHCEELEALDRYLALKGVDTCASLPRRAEP